MVSDKQQFRVSAVASPRFLVTGSVPAGNKGLHPPAPTPQPPHQATTSSSSKARPQTAVGAHNTRQGQVGGVQKTSVSAQHRVPSSAQHDASQVMDDHSLPSPLQPFLPRKPFHLIFLLFPYPSFCLASRALCLSTILFISVDGQNSAPPLKVDPAS